MVNKQRQVSTAGLEDEADRRASRQAPKKKYSDQKGSSREFLRAGISLRYSEGTTTNWQRLEGMNRS